MKATYKLSFFILIASFSVLIFAHKVFAVSGTFPDTAQFSPGSAGVSAMVSIADNVLVTLNAKHTEFQIAVPKSYTGPVTVTVLHACDYDNPLNDVADTKLSARVNGTTLTNYNTGTGVDWTGNQGSCSGGDLIFNTDTSAFGTSAVMPGFWINSLYVDKQGGVGIKSFAVTAVTQPGNNKATISFSSDATWNVAAKPVSLNDAFSVWAAKPTSAAGGRNGSDTSDISFKFKPTCDYTDGTQVFFKWYDADQGESDQPSSLSFKITDLTTGLPVWNPGTAYNYGANGEYKEASRGLKKDHVYQWQWLNINTNNGLQLWLPFSENTLNVDCSQPSPANWSVNESVGALPTPVSVGATVTFSHLIKNLDSSDIRTAITTTPASGPGNETGINYQVCQIYSAASTGAVPVASYGCPPGWTRVVNSTQVLLSVGRQVTFSRNVVASPPAGMSYLCQEIVINHSYGHLMANGNTITNVLDTGPPEVAAKCARIIAPNTPVATFTPSCGG